ncbi:MAG TPA: TIGR01777 family oxidoreductase [Gemmatimonadales bacterium]|nr:TIGR01777 family oxidoreductase [Gemmatimonadales bacterium]
MTGASGLLGSAVRRRLEAAGHRVSRLVRRTAGPGEISWDPAAGSLNPAALEGIDAVVHLSGENVGARWTTARKARIRSSRVASTRLLSETLAGLQRPPQVMVSASAVGIYGNRGDEVLTEESPLGDPDRDFLVAVTREWEKAAEPARVEGIRVVHSRFGVVLSPAGGALKKMLLPFRLGLGARLGSGKQWMSWISIDDAVQAVHQALIDDGLQGPVNVTSPEPVTNRDFTRTLARVLSRPALFAVPESALRLALGEMARATILSSARVVPARLLQAGYRFGQPDLESALRHVLHQDGQDNFPP